MKALQIRSIVERFSLRFSRSKVASHVIWVAIEFRDALRIFAFEFPNLWIIHLDLSKMIIKLCYGRKNCTAANPDRMVHQEITEQTCYKYVLPILYKSAFTFLIYGFKIHQFCDLNTSQVFFQSFLRNYRNLLWYHRNWQSIDEVEIHLHVGSTQPL